MTDAAARLRRVLFYLFGLVVVVPAYLSWGRGLAFHAGVINISHHVAAPSIGIFGVLLCLIWFLGPQLRGEALAGLAAYDARPARQTARCELWVWFGLGLWLAFLKAQQSYFLGLHGYDMGVPANVLWNLAHGNGYWDSFLMTNYLGSHFAPFLYLLSLPYRWSASPLWALMAQTAALMLGFWLALLIARDVHPLRPAERILLLLFLPLNMNFQKIHSFDFHPIAFSLPVILALYWLAMRGRWAWVYAFLPFALFTIQEDVSLMVAGLALVLWFSGQKKHGALLLGAAIAAFFLNVGVIMTYMAGGKASLYLARYGTMGGSLTGIVKTFLLKPWVPLGLILRPNHLWPLTRVFISFGFLPLLAWPQALGLLPPVLQQSLSESGGQVGYMLHYSANLLPFLIIAATASLSRRKWPYPRLIPGFLIVAAYSCFRSPAYVRWTEPDYRASVRALAASIDSSIPVSGQDALVVPFAFRPRVYEFPDVRDARAIVLAPAQNPWPLSPDELNAEIGKLDESPLWRKEQMAGGVLVYRSRE